MNVNDSEMRISMILSFQRALLGEVLPQLRAVHGGWDDNDIQLYFIFDGEYTDEDRNDMECVATEVITDFVDDFQYVDTRYFNVPFPQPIPIMGKELLYLRKEPVIPKVLRISGLFRYIKRWFRSML